LSEPTVTTGRLLLRPFRPSDLEPFAALNADPLVVEWLASALTRAESDTLAERCNEELRREGWGRWAVEAVGVAPFVGLVGLHRVGPRLPCTHSVEVGWRLSPEHWGRGYASEAAGAALHFGFTGCGLDEIVSFTAATNVRSQTVMTRIGMVRDTGADFDHPTLPEGSPLRRHVLYRAHRSQAARTVG